MLENSKVIVDIDSCTRCMVCGNECSYYVFDSGEMTFHNEMDEFCIECGKCAAVCPVNAIRLKIHHDISMEDYPSDEDLPTFETLSNLFKIRRSRRKFKDDPVPRELIERILNVAGRYSATGYNEENVYFTIIQDRELLNKISEECTLQVTNLVEKFDDPEGQDSLTSVFSPIMMNKITNVIPSFKRSLKVIEKGEEVWHRNAEIIIIHSPKNSLSLIENCTLAAAQIMLAAETLGLGTCSLGYITTFFNQFRSIGKMAKIPTKHQACYTLAIGYPKAHYYRIPARKPLKAKWF